MACLKEIVALARHLSAEAIIFEDSKNSDNSVGVKLRIKEATFPLKILLAEQQKTIALL